MVLLAHSLRAPAYVRALLGPKFCVQPPACAMLRYMWPNVCTSAPSRWRAVTLRLVCHGCYDAPCQLKLDSYAGIARGASPQQVSYALPGIEPAGYAAIQRWIEAGAPNPPCTAAGSGGVLGG